MTATSITYKQLQAKLKDLRTNGYDVQVKLNSKLEVLQAEFDRLTSEMEFAIATATNTEVVTADEYVCETLVGVKENPRECDIPNHLLNGDEDIQSFVSSNSYGETQQYCDFFPYEPVKEVTDFDKTGNTKEYTFAGVTVYFIDGVDYFGWELDQWLTQHEGIACKRPADDELLLTQHEGLACDVTFEGVTKQQLKTAEVLTPSTLQGVTVLDEPLPLSVLLLACVLLAVVASARYIHKRVSTFARQQDETCYRACYNLLWLARCCYWFAVGFFRSA